MAKVDEFSAIGYWLKNVVDSQRQSGPKQFIAVLDTKGRRLYKIRGNEPLPGPKIFNLSQDGQMLLGGRVPSGSFRFVLDFSVVSGWGVKSKWLFIVEDKKGKTILDTAANAEHLWNFAEMGGQFTFKGIADQIVDLGRVVTEVGGDPATGLDVLDLIISPGGET